ncbi:genetic suppressor element 1 [Anaeramoeba flamelloides]|uniref:Genetic suppressor element 1 n=1 Tax=Anaeramoeba flamelloides TaxID=1746091 RepID=A0ABQ8Z9W4_9EUKA|nr:genetic suppressor element 1 [Anaeramoeba flamelloides]
MSKKYFQIVQEQINSEQHSCRIKKKKFCVWHGRTQSSAVFRYYYPEKMGGVFTKPKPKMSKKLFLCDFCYHHWLNYNRFLKGKTSSELLQYQSEIQITNLTNKTEMKIKEKEMKEKEKEKETEKEKEIENVIKKEKGKEKEKEIENVQRKRKMEKEQNNNHKNTIKKKKKNPTNKEKTTLQVEIVPYEY